MVVIENERNFDLSASELFPFMLKLVRKYIIKYLFMFAMISYAVIQQLSSLGKIKHIHCAISNQNISLLLLTVYIGVERVFITKQIIKRCGDHFTLYCDMNVTACLSYHNSNITMTTYTHIRV